MKLTSLSLLLIITSMGNFISTKCKSNISLNFFLSFMTPSKCISDHAALFGANNVTPECLLFILSIKSPPASNIIL